MYQAIIVYKIQILFVKKSSLQYTVECLYNVVQYCKILHKWLQELRQDISQMLDTQKNPTPYLALTGKLWEVFR